MTEKSLAERAQEHIAGKWVRPGPNRLGRDIVMRSGCPMCGGGEFEAGNALIDLHDDVAGLSFTPFMGGAPRALPITCTNCGNILLLNAKVAGLLCEEAGA